MISYRKAKELIKENITRETYQETVPLALCAGRVLAEDIFSAETIPANDNSSVDGYALLAEEVSTASIEQPIILDIVGESSAGKPYTGFFSRGQAVKIMTGAVLPSMANAVIEIEATHQEDGKVWVRKSVPIGNFIRRAGEDLSKNQLAISKGKLLRSNDVALLAAMGITNIPVKIKPIVAILSTGNELVEPHKSLLTGQARDSTSMALYSAVAEAGAEPIELGIARDNQEDLLDKVEMGLRYDILITTGGISMGEYDLIPSVLDKLGVTNIFQKVNIKPGKPVMFGVLRENNAPDNFVFSLPGNPVSTLVTFQIFVASVIRQMLGQKNSILTHRAILKNNFTKTDDKRHFLRGILSNDETGNLYVEIIANQSSGAISGLSMANCLVEISEQTSVLNVGELVNIVHL